MVELGQHPRLVDEAAQADVEGFALPLRAHRHRGVLAARGEQGGHVLLERDLAMQRMVLGQVDDAEAALADQVDDLELAEPRADRQRVLMQARGHHARPAAGR
jgi:hypothetical protein